MWSNHRSGIFIGHVLTAKDVLLANNPTETVSQASDKVDDPFVGQLALGYQLGVTRTTTKGPGAYGNACLALDLMRSPTEQPTEVSKLRLLVPAESLGSLTIGHYGYYRSQHTLFDTEAYLHTFER